MSLIQLDLLSLFPASLKTAARDTLVDFVSDQAKKLAGEELGRKLKQLRSDAAFNKQFEKGLQRAIQRFVAEYELEDEDLVVAIAGDKGFFKNETIQKTLLAILKKPGAYLGEDREKVVQSFESVLPNRRNRERVDKAATFLLQCLAEELWHLPELQPVYSLQFQRITAEATRQQVELQKGQLLALTELNSGIRDALLQLTDAVAERNLLSGGGNLALPKPPSRTKVYHNLPQPDYGRFIGREHELAQVYRILRPYPHSQHSLVTVDGIGGIGKSALVLEVTHRYIRGYDRIPEEERFDAIIWTSAKQTILTAEGIVTRPQAHRTLNDIYTTIAIALQREDITRARPEEQHEVVRNALTRQRTLLIVDNLETVDDEDVLTFLRELPAPTKAIVTTRHRIDVAYPVRLTGMPWEDAQRLIAQECEKKSVPLANDEARKLFDRTGGVPLALVWSIAQMGVGYGVEVVLRRLGEPTGDVARFCFDASLERIRGKSAFMVLKALSLFATDASREALGFIGSFDQNILGRDEAIATLEKLSLINRNRFGHFWILPITQTYILAGHMIDPAEGILFHKRQINYYINLIPEPSPAPIYTEEIVSLMKRELNNFLGMLDWSHRNGEYQLFLELFIRVYDFLGVFGQLDLRVSWGWQAIQAAEQVGDQPMLGRLYAITMGWATLKQGQLDQANQLLAKGIEILRETGEIEAECGALRLLGRLKETEGKIQEAYQIFQTTLILAKESGIKAIEAGLYSDLGFWEMQNGTLAKAETYLRDAMIIFETLNDVVRSSDRSIMLATILIRQEKFIEAEEYLIPSLKRLENEIGQLEAIAGGYACLAHIRAQQGRFDEAVACCSNAKEYYEKIGMIRDTFPIGLPVICKE